MVAILVDPRPKTEDNTNGDSRYWCLGTGLVHLFGAVRSIPSHIFRRTEGLWFGVFKCTVSTRIASKNL
jgi:hypothetical protein